MPCIGALIAARSAPWRRPTLLERDLRQPEAAVQTRFRRSPCRAPAASLPCSGDAGVAGGQRSMVAAALRSRPSLAGEAEGARVVIRPKLMTYGGRRWSGPSGVMPKISAAVARYRPRPGRRR